jgi:hypothetical protein
VNEWETESGEKKKNYEINANQVEFLSTKKNDEEFGFGGEE